MKNATKTSSKKLVLNACTLALGAASATAYAADSPNIVVIFGDDVGYWNLSTYSQGMMGYKTPNIDRIANEGAKFTDYYAQQSSTAGRAAFITGQMPVRTGLTKVGLPGSDIGISEEDPTLATMLQNLGYATGQYGKNHLGDKDEFLPTKHGFDEFFGNLYHLNAEEQPENVDWPKDPEFNKKFAPRGVIHSTADGKIEDTGPLTRKRMETVDDEFLDSAMKFIDKNAKADKPFFTWINTTRMHNKTHIADKWKGKTGLGDYADGMIEHDNQVKRVLDKLDELKIADNTIVVYTTDNGPMIMSWPDAGMTPFRSEKNTGWEGGFRVPAMVRWPGHIKPGTVINDIMAGEDWFPTLMAAVGEPNIKEDLLKGKTAQGHDYKVHLDGYNQLPLLEGKEEKGRRDWFAYWSDDGDLLAVRKDRWKLHFKIQEQETGWGVWEHPFTTLRVPKLFDLKMDPFERGDSSDFYGPWQYERQFVIAGIGVPKAMEILQSLKDYPPRQKPASFTIE